MKKLIKPIWNIIANLVAKIVVSKITPVNKKKSILFIIPWLTFGGAEKVNLQILEALKIDGWNISIVTTKANRHEWENEFRKYTNNILHIERLPKKLHSYIFSRLINKFNIKITFISNSFTGYLATPHIAKYSKIIDLVHGEGGTEDNGGSALFSSTYDQYISKRIVISDRLKDLYVNDYHINPEKIEVIRNGIDIVETLKEAEKAVLSEVVELFTNQQKKVVWVGRLSKEKQPLKVIELASKMPDYSFAIVGDGEFYDKLVRNSSKLTNLLIIGELPNNVVKKLISNSDILIMTSEYEGIPVVILEAMSLGKPVVSTNVGAINEMIIEDFNGYTVNPEQIIEGMPKLIEKSYLKKDALGVNAKQLVAQKFSKSIMQEKYLEIFNKIINE